MKKISSFILCIVFFITMFLPSFIIPSEKLNDNKASPKIVKVEKIIEKEVFITPPIIDLPETVVEAKLKPIIKYKEIPTYIVDTIVKYLPSPDIEKIYQDIKLLTVEEPIPIKSINSTNNYLAIWP